MLIGSSNWSTDSIAARASSETPLPSTQPRAPTVLEHQRLAKLGAGALHLAEHAHVVRPGGRRARGSETRPPTDRARIRAPTFGTPVDVDENRAIRAVAYWVTTHSKRFGDQMPTRSPRRTPRAIRPRATSEVCSQSCRYGRPVLLVRNDQRLRLTVPLDGPPEVVADGLAEQRQGAGSGCIREHAASTSRQAMDTVWRGRTSQPYPA